MKKPDVYVKQNDKGRRLERDDKNGRKKIHALYNIYSQRLKVK